MNNPRQTRLSPDDILGVLNLSPDATAIYTSEEIVIEMANDAMIGFWNKDKTVIGQRLEDAVPELRGQPFLGMLREVWNTGISKSGKGAPARIMVNGTLQTTYYDYTYAAIKDNNGAVYCILHSAADVTERLMSTVALQLSEEKIVSLNNDLEASNDELAVINEELMSSNEELIESEQNLRQLITQLQESESRFKTMIMQSPVPMLVTKGIEMIFETVNEPMLQVIGKDASIIGKPWDEAMPELKNQAVVEQMFKCYKSGKEWTGNEVPVLLVKNGVATQTFFNVSYTPLREDGETIGILQSAIDVTELVNARNVVQDLNDRLGNINQELTLNNSEIIDINKELQSSQQNLQQSLNKLTESETKQGIAIEQAQLGTWYLNIETNAFIPSTRLKEFFGFSENEEMPYEAFFEQIPLEHSLLVKDSVQHAIDKGIPFDISYPLINHKDQQQRWVWATGQLYASDLGNSSHFSGTMIDITEQKADDVRKSDFIGMVSHELKTPLTSLKSYIQLLQAVSKSAPDNITSVALDKAEIQVKKMTGMINGFLNVSRLESGKIQLDISGFAFSDLVAEIVEEAKVISTTHEIEFTACENSIVYADKDKLGNVVSNLLSNAVKYSKNGSKIEVTCKVENGTNYVSVKDSGIGIHPADQEKLFERYYRVKNDFAPHIAGFGIGLYLSAEIMHRHGGKIGVESSFGSGSRFWIELPASQIPA